MKYTLHIKDALFSIVTLVASFALNLLLQSWFHTQSLIPMIFVLGVFLISWRTQGYFWGVAASLVSVPVEMETNIITTAEETHSGEIRSKA